MYPQRWKDKKSFMDPRRPVKTADPVAGVDVPRGVNTFQELGDAMGNVPAYMDEVFRRTEGMKIKRDFLEFAERAMAAGNKYLTKTFLSLVIRVCLAATCGSHQRQQRGQLRGVTQTA